MRLIFFLGVPDATKPEVTLYPVHIGRFGARTVAARVHGLADLVEQFCFTYRHSLHTHRIERVSCDCSIWVNAFDAISRIASRAAFSGLSVESITSIPAVEVCQPICAICAPRDEVRAFSCSYERIKQRQPCLEENRLPMRFRPPRVYALPKCRVIRHIFAKLNVPSGKAWRTSLAYLIVMSRGLGAAISAAFTAA